MTYTITVSSETYELLERRASKEGRSPDQIADMLLKQHLWDIPSSNLQELWQNSIDRLLREMAGLRENEPLDIPSAQEIREEISKHIPPDVKLSDEIVAMREE